MYTLSKWEYFGQTPSDFPYYTKEKPKNPIFTKNIYPKVKSSDMQGDFFYAFMSDSSIDPHFSHSKQAALA